MHRCCWPRRGYAADSQRLERRLPEWFHVEMAFKNIEEVLDGIDFAFDDGGGKDELRNCAGAGLAINCNRLLNVFFNRRIGEGGGEGSGGGQFFGDFARLFERWGMLALHHAIVELLELRWVSDEESEGVARVGAGVDVFRNHARDGRVAGGFEGKRDGDECDLGAV